MFFLKSAFAARTTWWCVALAAVGCKGAFDTEWRSAPPLNSSSAFLSSVPKVIWQTVKSHEAPEAAIRAGKTWSTMNPSWDRIVLDDNDMVSFVKRFYNETELELFNDLKLGVMRADLFRYMAIYLFGGVYADADTESLAPIEEWAPAECDLVIACEYNEDDALGWESTSDDFCQWAFAARPRHPALALLIQMIFEAAKSGIDYTYSHFVHEATGPAMFTRALKKFYKIQHREFDSCESFVTSSRAKEMRRDGVCWMTQAEMKKSLQNLFSSTQSDFKGLTWESWVEEKNRVLRDLGIGGCELSCENTDDDIQDVIEQMADIGYGVSTGALELTVNEGATASGRFVSLFDSFFDDNSTAIRMGGQDAFVFRGCLPPPLAYFGVTAYVSSYIISQDENNEVLEERKLGAELGDSLNHLRWENYEENPDSLFDAPFDRKTNFVITGDNHTWTDLITAFEIAELSNAPENTMNLLQIPSSLSDLIVFSESELDVPRSTFRFDLIYRFSDPATSVCNPEIYLNQSFPFYIFYKDAVDPRVPFEDGGALPSLPRGGQQDERDLKKTQKKVVKSAKKKAKSEGYCLVEKYRVKSSKENKFGFCFKDDATCDFGSQDILEGSAQVPTDNLSQEMHLAVGVIHTSTKLAEYASFGFSSDMRETKLLSGTANAWEHKDNAFDRLEDSDLEKIFVLQIKEDCLADDVGCLEFPLDTLDHVEYIEESFLEAKTKTGPVYGDVLAAFILKFEECP